MFLKLETASRRAKLRIKFAKIWKQLSKYLSSIQVLWRKTSVRWPRIILKFRQHLLIHSRWMSLLPKRVMFLTSSAQIQLKFLYSTAVSCKNWDPPPNMINTIKQKSKKLWTKDNRTIKIIKIIGLQALKSPHLPIFVHLSLTANKLCLIIKSKIKKTWDLLLWHNYKVHLLKIPVSLKEMCKKTRDPSSLWISKFGRQK